MSKSKARAGRIVHFVTLRNADATGGSLAEHGLQLDLD